MKNLNLNHYTKHLLTALITITFSLQINAECSISTPTPQIKNPGSGFIFNVTFNTSGQSVRRIFIENFSGFASSINAWDCHIEHVEEIDGESVSDGMPQVLGNSEENPQSPPFLLPGGDHQMQIDGFIPSNIACGQFATFKLRVQKRIGLAWFNECDQIFSLMTNTNGSVAITGPNLTCGNLPQNYSVLGTSATQYVWTSSNTSYELNGSNQWPITTSTGDIIISPTIAGSSTSLSVTATGPSICVSASSSINVESVDAALTISGAPYVCNSIGNSIMVQANELPGATYNWFYKEAGALNWINAGTSASNTFTVPAQNTATTFLIKCHSNYNGCSGRSNMLTVSWCVNNNPQIPRSCCIKKVPSEKKKAESKSAKEHSTRVVGSSLNVNLYPNPSNGNFSVTSNEPIDKVLIYNTMGKLMQSLEGEQARRMEINLENLSTGVYMVYISSLNQTVAQKIIYQ